MTNYCILMADTCRADLDEIVREKIQKNAEKYRLKKQMDIKKKVQRYERGGMIYELKYMCKIH